MIIENGVLVAAVGGLSSLATVIVQKAFSRKKDAVDIQSQIIQDLYKEIARLKLDLEEVQKNMQADREAAATKEEELQNRIEELESENKKQATQISNQASEIRRLKEELKHVKGKN